MILKVDDGELYYETEGQGVPCLVPVRGYQGYLTRTLSEHPPALPAPLPAHVRQRALECFALETATLVRVLEDFATLRRQLGLERLGILGHSAMGCMALELARRQPQTRLS